MLISRNFPILLFSLLLVTLSIPGVAPNRCLWEILYEVGQLLVDPSPEPYVVTSSSHFFNVWDETEICHPDDVRDQHQKNFGPAPKSSKYTEDSRKKSQVTNHIAITTKIPNPRVVDFNSQTPKVTVKHRTNFTMKPTDPRQDNEGINLSYYSSRLSSETMILIGFLATVIAIALYLWISFYRKEKKHSRNASNNDSLQSVVSAFSGYADDSENEVNEILLDDISNLTSTMMVRTYLESLVKELKSSHSKENIKKYVTEEFLTMVSERIARDAYMRMNFMVSITPESLYRLAHLYHLTGMHQQKNLSSIMGTHQEKNINVILKVGKGFELKTKTELKEVSEDVKDSTQDGSTQTDVEKQSPVDDGTATEVETKKESQSSSSSSGTTSCSTGSSSSTTSSSTSSTTSSSNSASSSSTSSSSKSSSAQKSSSALKSSSPPVSSSVLKSSSPPKLSSPPKSSSTPRSSITSDTKYFTVDSKEVLSSND